MIDRRFIAFVTLPSYRRDRDSYLRAVFVTSWPDTGKPLTREYEHPSFEHPVRLKLEVETTVLLASRTSLRPDFHQGWQVEPISVRVAELFENVAPLLFR